MRAHDPVAAQHDALHEYGAILRPWRELPRAAAIVGAVPHRELKKLSVEEFAAKLHPNGVYVDVKGQIDAQALRARGVQVWRL